MTTLVIQDLAGTRAPAVGNDPVRTLSRQEMQAVQGGRLVSVLVDGRAGGVVDDFQLEMAIFKGDIGVRVV